MHLNMRMDVYLPSPTLPVGEQRSKLTNGNLVSILNPDGSTRTFAYDNNHTLTSQTGVDAERSEYVNRQDGCE